MKNKYFTDKFVLPPKFVGVGSMEDYCENKFFTDKFVLTPQFAGIGSMEDHFEQKLK